jgi:hypothetical protein
LPAEQPARLHHFQTASGDEIVVGWSTAGHVRADLPRPASRVVGRDGERLEAPAGPQVDLDRSPRYFWLER